MLPPGHIAAGYLTALVVIKLSHFPITVAQNGQLLLLGMLIGFIPDIDMFTAFAKIGKFSIDPKKADHRKYITHASILWLAAGLAVYFIAPDPFYKLVGLIIWLASWSHFVLDTLQYGIMWLWPFSTRLFAVKDRENKKINLIEYRNFFQYWLDYVRTYMSDAKLTFYVEAVLLISVLYILFK